MLQPFLCVQVLKHPTIQRISVAQNCTCAQVELPLLYSILSSFGWKLSESMMEIVVQNYTLKFSLLGGNCSTNAHVPLTTVVIMFFLHLLNLQFQPGLQNISSIANQLVNLDHGWKYHNKWNNTSLVSILLQVVLSWALQKHQVVVPRSSKHAHIIENLNAQNCYLPDIQVKEIDALDGHVPQ